MPRVQKWNDREQPGHHKALALSRSDDIKTPSAAFNQNCRKIFPIKARTTQLLQA
jgi:hypothetical protein